MNSNVAGTTPAEVTSVTVCAAASNEGKETKSVRTSSGTGRSAASNAVTIPRVPSEPTKRAVKS